MTNGRTPSRRSTRREFLGTTAGAVAAAPIIAAAASAEARPIPRAKGRILGANDRIGVAFIGTGMQFHALLRRAFDKRKQAKGDFEYAAVCDVWQPRLDYAKAKTQAPTASRDYREILARSDVDGVVIAVPDHWHYQIAREALLAGKDVYLEKPMTHTIEEAARLNDLVARTGRVLQVGGSGVNSPLHQCLNGYIKSGKMGKVLWGLISYNRNTRTGMWDYPIPGVGGEHWPNAEVSERNLDWKMWLGPARKRRFSPERYFRWRKYWDYSGGNATDLLFHRLGAMSAMIGFDFPTQAVASGGIYVQKNREVPDTYMTAVEYPGEYCVNMVSCMGNAESAPISVFGNWGTLQIVDRAPSSTALPATPAAPPAAPPASTPPSADAPAAARRRRRAVVRAERPFETEFKEANEGRTEVTFEEDEVGTDLVDDWLDCMRTRSKPIYDVLKGYQVTVAIRLGVDSYREGRALGFDPASRRVLSKLPERKVHLPADA